MLHGMDVGLSTTTLKRRVGYRVVGEADAPKAAHCTSVPTVPLFFECSVVANYGHSDPARLPFRGEADHRRAGTTLGER